MWVNGLNKFISAIDYFTKLIGNVIAWFTLVMVLLTFAIVVLRYGFSFGSIAIQESVLYFHGLVFMLGAAYTLKEQGHVRVDIFYQKYSPYKKALVDIFGSLFLLLPVCIFIFVVSFDYVAVSWQIKESSPEAGGLPFVYLSKGLLLLLAVTLSLQGLAEVGRNLLVIIQHKNISQENT